MNIPLLRKIQEQIKKEPKQFDMSNWFTFGEEIPNCGTAACIAGWAVALHQEKTPREAFEIRVDYEEKATTLLELTAKQAGNLFFQSYWPTQFRIYEEPEHERAIKRIEHLIQTGE